jgi:threonylcarbamoyladenosine tRNA methylthiotransferase MtaB
MIDWITSGSKFLPHYHIPLQSGCDTILKAMGRRYDTAAFAEKIQYIRSKSEVPGGPKVFFGIDVIVGFPGETDELFMETYEFLRDVIRPAFIHIFPYSRRAGTPAAERKDQVQDCVKTKRVQMLEELCRQLHEEFIAAIKGVLEKVLFESTDRKGMMEGYTGNYIRISRPFDAGLIGKIADVTI